MRKLLATLGAVALLVSGCEEEPSCGSESATMCPGDDCLDCHGSFKVAGTVFTGETSTTPASGVTVTISPASGSDVVLTTNSAGNFYTSQTLAFPLTVSVGAQTMGGAVAAGEGGCNTCHDAGMRVFP